MKQKEATEFHKNHQVEIQAVRDIMQEIGPKLEALRANHPKIGYMLYIGIDDPKNHWVHEFCDISRKLAREIIRDELQEEEDLRDWVMKHIDENVGGGYVQHFDLSESAKVQK